MRVVVFGATGRTGRQVVEQAVARGHTVRAVSRSAVPTDRGTRPEVEWTRADVADPSSVGRAVTGAGAVISTVGVGTSRGETRVYSDGVANITRAVAGTGTRRLAVVSAAPVGNAPDASGPSRLVRRMLWAAFGSSYRDMTRMEQALAGHPELGWVCLRPPYLREGAPTGRYRIDVDRPVRGAASITTGDLAAALLDVTTGPAPGWHVAWVGTVRRGAVA